MLYLYILITLLFSAFFSGSEIAYVSADKLRLQLERSRGGITSRILGILYARPDRFITSMLLGNNIALVLYGILMASLLEPLLSKVSDSDIFILAAQSIIGTIIILFTGEFIPKVAFRSNPNAIMSHLAGPIFLIYALLYPFTYIISLISRGLLLLVGQKRQASITTTFSTIDLEHYLESSHGEDSEHEVDSEVKFIQNAISFPSLQVRDCMIPRNEIVAVEISQPISVLEEKFVRTGFSKLIVYREHIDDIVGYIHSSEMFGTGDWTERIVPAIFVTESMYASKLMKQLMQHKRSIAIVIDELGGTAGMITLEDVVEEIFGDIEDEHDRQSRVCRQVDERTYLLSGRIEIDDLNERFALGLPEGEDFMTIAGFILHHHQSIPKVGERIDIGEWTFEILRSTSTKIVLVKLLLPEAH